MLDFSNPAPTHAHHWEHGQIILKCKNDIHQTARRLSGWITARRSLFKSRLDQKVFLCGAGLFSPCLHVFCTGFPHSAKTWFR